MKALSSTYIYKHFDNKVDIQKSLVNLMTRGKVLNNEDILDSLNIIKKNFNFVGKNKILAELDNKNIILTFNHDTTDRLTEAIPTFLLNRDNTIKSIVNLTNISVYSKKTESYRLDERKLYSYLNTAYLLLQMQKDNINKIKFNRDISNITAKLYSYLFVRVLNKVYRLNADKYEHDKALAMIYKFCSINMLELSNDDNLLAYAVQNTSLSKEYVKIVDSKFKDEDFKDISKFIPKLAENIKGLKDMTVTNFIENYIKMYGISTVFGLEYLPYFYHMIFSVSIGAFLNNQYSIENVIEKDVDKLFANIMSKY